MSALCLAVVSRKLLKFNKVAKWARDMRVSCNWSIFVSVRFGQFKQKGNAEATKMHGRRRKRLRIALPILLMGLLLLRVEAAEALTITQEENFSFSYSLDVSNGVGFNPTLTFAQFDTLQDSLNLLQVRWMFDASVTLTSWSLTGLSGVDATFSTLQGFASSHLPIPFSDSEGVQFLCSSIFCTVSGSNFIASDVSRAFGIQPQDPLFGSFIGLGQLSVAASHGSDLDIGAGTGQVNATWSGSASLTYEYAPVPEPATLLLLGSGLAGLGLWRRRKQAA